MKNCVTVENSYYGYWEDRVAKIFKDKDYYDMAYSTIKALNIILT